MLSSKNSYNLNSYANYAAWFTFIPIVCIFIACFSPLLFYFFNINNIGLGSEGYSLFVTNRIESDPTQLKFWQSILATLLDTLPILILLYGFYQLRLQFVCYANGDYFSVKASNYCYNFGKSLVAWVVLGIMFEPVLSLILSANSPQGLEITISLSSDDIIIFFPALSIMIIGQILKKACQIAAENEQFV